ncbi:MAG: tetratricopeptide repeat protein [Candidatus Heimdallarchaeota archaeon]
MPEKIAINTMIARNVYASESFEFIKNSLKNFCNYEIKENPIEIHRQNKTYEYTDEYRIYGTREQGVKYHTHYKIMGQGSEDYSIFHVSNETFGFADFWIKFTISTHDGLILEFDVKDEKNAKKITENFEADFGYCREQSKEEIFDELIDELRTLGTKDHGQYGIKLGLKAVEIFPKDFWARFYLGCSFALNNKQSLAIKHLEEAVKIDPKSYDALYNLGRSYLDNKDYNNAKRVLLDAVKLSPKNHAIIYHLALAYDELKLKDEALKYYQKAIETAPEKTTKGLISFYAEAKEKSEKIK